MRFQKLEAVCNGLHIFNVNKSGQMLMPNYHDNTCSFSVEELADTMCNAGESKAILVLDVKRQKEVVAELEKLDFPLWETPSIKKSNPHLAKAYKDRNFRLQAKKLGIWSQGADLWMVRWVFDNQPWCQQEIEGRK